MAPSIRPRLTVERLEPREIPAAGLWTIEGFNAADPAIPPDWSQWAPVGQPFHTGPLTGVRASGSLSSASAGRAWEGTVLPEDFAARAFLRGDTPAPVQVFIRGRDLDTVRPTYDAAELSAGGTVRLISVEKGNATVLGAVSPATPVGGRWLAVTLRPAGNRLDVEVRRSDTGQFLTPAGRWQSGPVAAIRVTDGHIRGEGRAGVNRPAGPSGQVHVDDFALIAPDLPPSYSFDAIAPGELPAGVNAWGNTGASGFAVSASIAVDGRSLSSAGSSATSGRAWIATPLPSDVTASATVLVNSLIPAQIILRGRDLDTPRPTYLAASVVRGTELKILRVMAGVTTELVSVRTNRYLSGGWIDISFTAQGDRLQVRARRRDTGQWLNKFGDWQAEPAAALDAREKVVLASGLVGVGRPPSYAGTIYFDDLNAGPAIGDLTPPQVTASLFAVAPVTDSATLAGVITLSASVIETGAVARVEFFIDGELVARRTTAPWSHSFESRDITNGMHALSIRAWDSSGNVGETSQAFTVLNSPLASGPVVPRHYAHIRYAALAYSGNPMGAAEAALLRNSVDLVVPNIRYLARIDASAPHTPQPPRKAQRQ